MTCAEYSYICRFIWDWTDEEARMNMTLPPAKEVPAPEKPEFEVTLIKCFPLQNENRATRYLCCAVAGNSKGTIGFGEKYAATRKKAEEGAKADAMKNLRKVNTRVLTFVEGKCGEISVCLQPTLKGSGLTGAPIAIKLSKLAGIDDCVITGCDSSIYSVRAFAKAIRKIK